jgi:hypothetical protein
MLTAECRKLDPQDFKYPWLLLVTRLSAYPIPPFLWPTRLRSARGMPPNEYYLIDSTNPKVSGLDGAVGSFVQYLYALA